MISPTATDCACAAGWLDGEGCININSRRTKGGRSPSFRLVVIISNNDIRAPEWFMARWAGAIQTQTSGDRTNVGYAWTLWGRQALAFLEAVRPYLVIKGEQADLAIAFQCRVAAPRVGQQLLEGEVAGRQALMDRLKSIKTARFEPKKQREPSEYVPQ